MKNKKILIPIIIFVIVLLITGIGYISHVNKRIIISKLKK